MKITIYGWSTSPAAERVLLVTLVGVARQDQIDSGALPGTTSEESAQIKAMKKEIAELKRANEILKAAASFFASMSGCWRSAGGHGPKPPLAVGP